MSESYRHAILIIDDEEYIRSSLRRLLRPEFDVILAHSATDALDLMRAHEFQIVISDQRMPGMNGSEFLSQIKGEYPDAIRILLTGYSDIESVVKAINSGQIFRYIPKPWNPDELLAIVREASSRYNLIIQNRRLTEALIKTNAELEQRIQARTAELMAANLNLRELNRLKDEFLAITSHDLRSPLTNILITAERLLDEERPISPAQQQRYLRHIYDASRHIIEMVDDLLDLARIESGHTQMERTETQLSTIVQKSINALHFNASTKHITISLDVPPVEPTLWVDSLKLYRVFNNLLSNAIKFTPEGGAVRITLTPSLDHIAVAMTDTGIGIAPSEMQHLFQKFGPSRATSTDKGNGLGLAIVRHLVELHGGHVEVASIPTQGSTFTVFLPLEAPPTQTPSPPAP